MKRYSIYVLWSVKLKKRYTGCTENLEKRILEHNAGKQRSTRGGIPWNLLYIENYNTLSEARKRESYLKSRSLDKIK